MPTERTPSANIAELLRHREAFLRFIGRRLGAGAAAEDLFQEALTRVLSKADALPTDRVVPWFYRVLRNGVIDHLRRQTVAASALGSLAHELPTHAAPAAWQRSSCACVNRLAAALKPEYADALKGVEIAGTPITAYAAGRGLTANAAGVRVFRARQALRRKVIDTCGACAETACIDCSCTPVAAAL